MLIFKYFWKILNQHKIGMLIYLAIFLGMSVMFSNVGGNSNTDSFQASSVRISIINRDNHPIAEELIAHLDDLHELVTLEDELGAMQDAIFFQDVQYILIIPKGFGETFANNPDEATLENVRLPSSTAGVYIDQQIDGYLSILRTYLAAEFPLEEALAHTSSDVNQQINVTFLETESTNGLVYFFQFIPFVFSSVIVLALGPIFVIFKQVDLAKRMECSALPSKNRNIQVIIACITCSFIIWIFFMLVAHVLHFDSITSHLGRLYMLNSLAFLIVCVGIAFLLGQLVKNVHVLSGAANIISLGMSFLTGVFVPQELLGEGVQTVGRFIPSYWYIRSNNMLALVSPTEGADMNMFLQGIGIQLCFAIALFALALVIGREKKLRLA